MAGIKFLSALAASSQERVRRLAVRLALLLASILSAVVGLGFGTHALYYAWRVQYGAINASIGVGAIYLAIAIVLYLCSRRGGKWSSDPPSLGLRSNADALTAGAQAAGASQAAALGLGVELAKQLTPLQLVMLSALSGFVAGRRL